MELNEKQKKTLKLFSMYIQSYGAKVAAMYYHYLGDGSLDYKQNNWYLKDSSVTAESYDSIDELLDELIEEHDLINRVPDEGDLNYFTLEFKVNCIEKTLLISTTYTEMKTEDSGNSLDISEEFDEHEQSELKKIAQENGKTAQVSYDGSGDSGYIEERMEFNRGRSISVPSFIEDKLYGLLESNYGGWEINEGSNGVFHFDFENNTIDWNHSQNYEESFSDDLELGHF